MPRAREIFLTAVTPGLRSAVIREGRRLASVHVLDVPLPASEVADGARRPRGRAGLSRVR